MFESSHKKLTSASFSIIPSTPVISEKYNSFSADKTHLLKQKQKIQQKKIVSWVIDNLNESKQAGEAISWRLLLFEQKRKIPGFKGKIEWHDTQRDMKVLIKISFNSNYYRFFNNLSENDLFAEIEELNFQLDFHQKKYLQEQTEKIFAEAIEKTKLKPYNDDETKKPTQCLKNFLLDFNSELKKNIYKNKKKAVNKIDKHLSKKMILYPSPANISWNPSGHICITENKYPSNKKSFFAQSNTLRRYFQTKQQHNMLNIKQQQQQTINQKQQSQNGNKQNLIYEWKIEQQINLLIFNENDAKLQEKYTNNEIIVNSQVQNKKQIKKKDEDYIDVANINRIPSIKLRKIYSRYFGEIQRNVQFGRQDKLKVYQIKKSKCPYEDDINYLVQKLISTSQKSKISIIFHNQLSLYPHLSVKMDQIKYKVLCKIINQSLKNSKIAYSMNLKIFILENQYFDTIISNYFRQLYRIIDKKPHYLLYYLSSYLHFDNIKAELFFIDIVEQFLKRNETKSIKTLMNEQEGRIKIKTKLKIPKIQFESVISQSDKNTFLMNIFPLLIAKDREKQRHEYRSIKRIITANNKIFKFIKKMNELITKLQQGKLDFIKNIIDKYKQFNSDALFEQMNSINSKRIFFFYCIHCHKISKIYDLVKENLQICQKCRQLVFKQ